MSYIVEIDSNGRVLIPAKLRGKLNLQKGDKIALIDNGESIALIRKADRLKEAQQLFQEMLGDGEGGGVEDFLKFRKEEATIENSGMDS